MSARAVLVILGVVLAVALNRVHVVITPPGATVSALAAVTVAGYILAGIAAVILARRAQLRS